MTSSYESSGGRRPLRPLPVAIRQGLRPLVLGAFALIVAARAAALAGNVCVQAGRSFPNGTAFRLPMRCNGLQCRVTRCQNGYWVVQTRQCRLGEDCPPERPF